MYFQSFTMHKVIQLMLEYQKENNISYDIVMHTLFDQLFFTKIDFNIIAPGSIKSKMTKEIIDVGSKLGDEYSSALKTFNEGGQEKENIVQLCRFLLSGKSNGITGKLIAAQWDNIEEYDLGSLRNDKNLFTLRRIDKKFFIEKKDTK